MSGAPDGAADFDRCAASYEQHRPVDDNWWEVYERLVELGSLHGRRVLEIGCGTGRLAAALQERAAARVWAIDASTAMIEQARALGVNARVGRAEALPFKRGWFDAVVMRMALHLLDRERALAESARVLAPGGRVALASEDPAGFDEVWFARFFPSVPAIDRARFPTAAALAQELEAAGLSDVRIESLTQERTIERERALALIRARAYSTFALLDESEYAEGVERAEAELPALVEYRFDWLLARATR